jgi:uncharacterized protein (DUF983 family)
MNGPMAFCPRCKKDVIFADAGRFRSCTVCGFQFALTEPTPEPDWVESAVMTVGHVLLRVILIAGVVILVGVAVVFASCALHF